MGDSCHLTLTHDQMREGADAQIYGGWPMVLSGLKTWLETGELLTTPGSILLRPDDDRPCVDGRPRGTPAGPLADDGSGRRATDRA